MGMRELVALLSLPSWCLVMVVWLFLAVPWVFLRFVIVVFPAHTHLLFFSRLKLNHSKNLRLPRKHFFFVINFWLEIHFPYLKLTFITRNSFFFLETRFSYSKLTFLTRKSLFLLETHFSYSKLTFITRNSLFLFETRFSYSKLTFITWNSLFLLKTRFSYSKPAFLTQNSLFLLETHYLLKVNHLWIRPCTLSTRFYTPQCKQCL